MNDPIERQAAIDEIARWIGYIDKDMILRIQIGLKKIPSAQRTGRWIWSDEEWGYRCSACRVKFDYDKTYELFDHGFMFANYCPNCGAKMEEETDE